MDYESRVSAIWGTVVVLVVAIAFAIIGLQIKTNHDFDTTCIQNHRSVTYITLEGQSSPLKICK